MTDLDDLKHHIRTEWTWTKLDHAVIAASVHQWRLISQGASRPTAVISSTVYDYDIVFSAITTSSTTCLTVVDQLNSCTLIGRFGSIPVVSDFVLCNHGDCLFRTVK